MSTPLSATGRILVPYTIDGFSHVAHAYVKNPQLVGAVYNVNSRATDANDLLWENAAQGFVDALGAIGPTGMSFGTCILQKLISTLWTPLATYSPGFSVTGGTSRPGSQVTLTLRDVNFKKVKVIFLDSIELPPQKVITPTGGDAGMDALVGSFLSTGAATYAPYKWIVGRGNAYLNTSPFVKVSVRYNETILRAHGT